METDSDLDEMMKKYTFDLMKVYEKRSKILPEEMKSEEAISEKETVTEQPDENIPNEQKGETVESAGDVKKEEVQKDIEKIEEPESKASFYALVTTGEGAYPVENAKVIVGKNDIVYNFLVTDESGKTEKVFLPAYKKEDSLSPDTAKTVEYYADVYAKGFSEKRNLKVSAVGESEIVLNVDLIPNEERME